jgi:hypothetical protein
MEECSSTVGFSCGKDGKAVLFLATKPSGKRWTECGRLSHSSYRLRRHAPARVGGQKKEKKSEIKSRTGSRALGRGGDQVRSRKHQTLEPTGCSVVFVSVGSWFQVLGAWPSLSPFVGLFSLPIYHQISHSCLLSLIILLSPVRARPIAGLVCLPPFSLDADISRPRRFFSSSNPL